MHEKIRGLRVKELADVAKISVRTLHYYDQIGLLKPSRNSENGYRYYDDAAVLRLQQIRFYSDLGLSLKNIALILDDADFDTELALEKHKIRLEQKLSQIQTLMQTIDHTLLYMKGQKNMTSQDLFAGFDQAKQKEYEKEVKKRWGDKYLKESKRRWKSYSEQKQKEIIAEQKEIYASLVPHIGQDPDSAQVQAIIAGWHENIRYFYEPSLATLRGLAQLYTDDPSFRETFTRLDADLPEFLRQAIEHYCNNLSA